MEKCVQVFWRFAAFVCLLMVNFNVHAQQLTISGKVFSGSDQSTLPGVSVKVKGSSTGVVTDANGNYRISATRTDVLVFSFVGFTTQEVAVSSAKGNTLNVTLQDNISQLEQVIVVGYGTQRKSDVTGSIVSVKSSDLNAVPTTSISEMLRGKAPGVQITTETSRPGGNSNILIRGTRSLGGGNGPLYVVDGVPVNNINDINSSDIASLEVLKDASSQAIYGARAANGVILITTKRGTSGKATVDYNAYTAVQTLKKNFSLYSGEEWANLRREAFRFENAQGNYESDEVVFDNVMRDVLNSNTPVDWQDFMINDAWSQKHDLSIRGGSEKTKVAASFGFFKQNGMVEGAGFKRGTGRLNVDQVINSKISLGASLAYTRQKINVEDGNLNEYIITPPLAKPYDENGNLQLRVTNDAMNPKFLNQQTLDETRTQRLLMNVFANFDLFKGFRYRINASANSRDAEGGSYRTKLYEKGSNVGNAASVSSTNYNDYQIENILSYDKRINKDHQFDVTLMQSFYKEVSKSLGASGTSIPTDILGYNGLPSAQTMNTPTRSFTDRSLTSYMGRLRYSLMDKYLFTFTSRIDGSSVFGRDNKYGVFPSAAVAWKMEQEEFIKSIKAIDQLKLRVNYGQVGNQAISPYTTLGEVGTYPYLFGDGSYQTGYLPGTLFSNPNLKWETTTALNLGLDFSLFNSRISGSAEYYHSKTTDLLVYKSIPRVSGYQRMLDNLGATQNKGFEFLLSTVPVRTKDLNVSFDINFSANRNKLLKITGETDANGKPIDDLNNRWFIGQPVNVYYDYLFDGIWQTGDDIAKSSMPTAKPGDIRVKDLNGDNKIISADDRAVIKRDPDWYGSFTTNVRYKAFDLVLDFYTVQGSVRSNPYLYDFNSGGSLTGKTNGIKVNYWTPENPSNEFPRPRFSSSMNYFSSLSYQDNSYIQFRTATLAYTLPAVVTNTLNIQKVRAYVTGNNLFYKTDFASYSPDVTPGGYPEPRIFLFGLNVTF